MGQAEERAKKLAETLIPTHSNPAEVELPKISGEEESRWRIWCGPEYGRGPGWYCQYVDHYHYQRELTVAPQAPSWAEYPGAWYVEFYKHPFARNRLTISKETAKRVIDLFARLARYPDDFHWVTAHEQGLYISREGLTRMLRAL